MGEAMVRAVDQIESVIEKIISLPSNPSDDDVAFYMGCTERMILSAIVDADRLDTAKFMKGNEAESVVGVCWVDCLERVEEKLNSLPCERVIDCVRRQISDCCKVSAQKPGGIFQLKVPTGGGKTISSLRYALAHAAKYKKKHIIFTAPLLTILEQNAKVIRDYIQEDAIILEHHSDVIRDTELDENTNFYSAAIENWDVPIVITTMVQLLNTMFSGGMSAIRRFHSLADSIIVIDEVQTIPLKMLSLFNLMVSFLANICGTTVVLCSATQPCLEVVEHPLFPIPEELVSCDAEGWNVFKRTILIDKGPMKMEEVPSFAKEILEQAESLLIICNKKSEARVIFSEMYSEKVNCFFLSASLCKAHRCDVLERVYTSLSSREKKTVCISTQVIEAGVDISFESVIRLSAGLDHIIQSAGRCNRNAEKSELSPVYIISVPDENLVMLPEIKREKDAVISLLEQYRIESKKFEDNLASEKAIQYYYRQLYTSLSVGATEYAIANDTLYNLLGLNRKNRNNNSEFYFQQAFKTAGDEFCVIDGDAIEVVVPYGRGVEIIEALSKFGRDEGMKKFRKLLNEAKSYTITVYESQRKWLEESQGIRWLCEGKIAVVSAEYYDKNIGFTMEQQFRDYLEV